MISRKYKFEICENVASADYLFDAYGRDLNELFAACAWACFSAMTNPEKVRPSSEFTLELQGESVEELLYNFISELIYLKDAKKIFLSAFDVTIASDNSSLNAVVAGESIDYNMHTIKTDVKAATYHDLRIEKIDGGYKAHMLLDL